MRHPCVSEIGIRVDCAPYEAAEERSRSGAIEAVIVIEDSDPHLAMDEEG